MPARRDKGQLLYGSPLLDGLRGELAMAVAPVGLTVCAPLPGAPPCNRQRFRPLAPHRGVSRRLSGSLVFRSIGLILVFGEDPLWLVWVTVPTIASPRRDVHPLQPVRRHCGHPEMLPMRSFGDFGNFGTSSAGRFRHIGIECPTQNLRPTWLQTVSRLAEKAWREESDSACFVLGFSEQGAHLVEEVGQPVADGRPAATPRT